MDHEIRQLTIDDYDAIIRVWAEAGLPFKPDGRDRREGIEREMSRVDTAFLGMFEDGRMTAIGLATYDGRKGWIQRVAVDPDRRGEGRGGAIVTACEEFLKAHGATVISCLIEDENAPSMEMFRKLGYSCWDCIKYFSKRDSDES